MHATFATKTCAKTWAENDTHQQEHVRDTGNVRDANKTTIVRNTEKIVVKCHKHVFFADNILQPLTKLKADTVQTTSKLRRQCLNFACHWKLMLASTSSGVGKTSSALVLWLRLRFWWLWLWLLAGWLAGWLVVGSILVSHTKFEN